MCGQPLVQREVIAGPDLVCDTQSEVTVGPDLVCDTQREVTAGPDLFLRHFWASMMFAYFYILLKTIMLRMLTPTPSLQATSPDPVLGSCSARRFLVGS